MSIAAPFSSPVERVILRDVSWRLYQQLLAEVVDSPGTRITYDNGLLQIMVVSAGHDNPNRSLAEIVALAAEEANTDCCPMGSTTFQRPDLLKGFEPDSCFYFRNAAGVRAKDDIDLAVDPPPDLVIEIDVTRDCLDRFPIFAAVGVAEVWRYSEGVVSMFALHGGTYQPTGSSAALPVLSAQAVTKFLEESRRRTRPEWLRSIREWLRNQDHSRI